MVAGWVHSMRQCAGLPAQPRVHDSGTPHVLFVNRAVASGRSVLSMGQVQTSSLADSSCSCTHPCTTGHLPGCTACASVQGCRQSCL